MKYLILGANGQLGKEWSRFLDHTNYDYDALGSSELDITDFNAVEKILTELKPNVIFNCAANTNVDQAEEDREQANLINHLAAENLAKLCAEQAIKLVHYSTDYVFSGTEEDRATYPEGYTENAQTDPVNYYGLSKLKGEQAIQQSEVEHLILRVSWLCGAYGNNFVKTMLRLGQERDSLSVVNDQFGTPTFCVDVVEQTMKLLEKDARGIFHLGSEGMITWFDFAKQIFELSGVEVDVKEVSSSEFKTKAKRPHFSKLNIKKAEKVLGEKSKTWNVGLQQLLTALNK